MTSQEAKSHIQKYLAVLSDNEKLGGRRNPALLPASKEDILTAIKLEIAQLYFINSATEELLLPLIRAAMFIDSFTHEPLDAVKFVEDMQRRRKEIQDFHSELMRISRGDAFYWQRVYALIGVSLETKSHTFFDTLKCKLGIGFKDTVNAGQTNIFRHCDEPYVLD